MSDLSLDLSRAPAVLYFYGLAGAGKTYVAQLVGELSGRPVYDADEDLTPELQRALAERRHFTNEMLDRFFEIVCVRINDLAKTYGRIVVSQATYRRRHREYLATCVEDMDMLWVTAPDELILERLRERGGDVTPEYAALMKLGFEPPPPGDKTVVNDDGVAAIVKQLSTMYGG